MLGLGVERLLINTAELLLPYDPAGLTSLTGLGLLGKGGNIGGEVESILTLAPCGGG